MSGDKMGGPAFPQPMTADSEGNFHHSDEHPDRIGGLRVWDYFAAAALNGIEASQGNNGSYVSTSEKVAEIAGKRADAMLAERAKRGGS